MYLFRRRQKFIEWTAKEQWAEQQRLSDRRWGGAIVMGVSEKVEEIWKFPFLVPVLSYK